MSDVTKVNALEKLAAVKRQIGYPDRWPDYSALAVARDSYCDNMMGIERWRFDHMLDSFGRPVDRTEWSMTPQTYSAYYSVSNNEIVLPAAIFSVPGVADSQVDDAVAFGYVGASTIGHKSRTASTAAGVSTMRRAILLTGGLWRTPLNSINAPQ